MRRAYYWAGMLIYLTFLFVLLRFDWTRFLDPQPALSVAGGILILTASQMKRGMRWQEVLALARWNAFISGLLTTLFMLLGVLTARPTSSTDTAIMAEKLIPLVYGSILYLLMGEAQTKATAKEEPAGMGDLTGYSRWFLPEEAGPILMRKGLSPREVHVALKLLGGITNKEIAGQLYISEATVKKHIQNMFRKCGAEDRTEFVRLYVQWVDEIRAAES